MDISGLEDECRLAAGKPMLLYLKLPAPDREPRLTEMIDSIRAAGTVSYRAFATPPGNWNRCWPTTSPCC
jgi:hypothetical protein